MGIKKTMTKTGAHGWPLVPSIKYPNEYTLACPRCGDTHVMLSVIYGVGGRLGDPGAINFAQCQACKNTAYARNNQGG